MAPPLSVHFETRLRDVMKFDGPDALVTQLRPGRAGRPETASANETGPPRVDSDGPAHSSFLGSPLASRRMAPVQAVPATAQLEATWDTARVWTDFEAALQRPERVLRLDLTRSKWKEVDHRLRRFRNLHELVLDRNRIDTLPDWLGELQTVERLSIRQPDPDHPPWFARPVRPARTRPRRQ